MFPHTVERHKVQDKVDNMATETCTEEDTEKTYTLPDAELETFVLSPRPKREAAQKANDSIHSLLTKKLQPMTLTMPKTPDVMK